MILKTPHANAATGSLVVTALITTGSTTQILSYHVPGVSHMHVSQFSKMKAMAGTGSYEFSGDVKKVTCILLFLF
jgi:hypothetical protein